MKKIYTDKLELQMLELKKMPKDIQTGEDIVEWMNFFNGKNKEDFERMAEVNEYLGEAYEALKKLSADDKMRIKYEARDKALKDYNTQIKSAEKRGEKRGERRGEKRGEKRGIAIARKVFQMKNAGKSNEEIASECNIILQKVSEILQEN